MSQLITSNFSHRMVIVIVALVAAGGAIVAEAQYQSGQVSHGGGSKQCCFNNFRFAGTCSARVGQNESCNIVLSYLNNFNSVGQAYCGNTTVRGGWTTVDCAAGSSSFEIETNTDLVTPQGATQAPRARSPQSTGVGRKSNFGTTGQNFVTPVSPSDVSVAEPGVINL